MVRFARSLCVVAPMQRCCRTAPRPACTLSAARRHHLAALPPGRSRAADDTAAAESAADAAEPALLPGLLEANVSYVLGSLTLLSMQTTPLAAAALSAPDAARAAAGLQWAAFVLPTAAYAAAARFPLAEAFGCRRCSARALGGAALAGASLWLLLGAAGRPPAEAAEVPFRLLEAAAPLWAAPTDASDWPPLLFWAALAPAAAHELLFRGWLLTCLRGTGTVSAVVASALLDACFHQSLPQLLPCAALALAAGGAASAARGVGPAIALHAAFSATGLGWAAAVAAGGDETPGAAVAAAAALGCAAGVAALWPDEEREPLD